MRLREKRPFPALPVCIALFFLCLPPAEAQTDRSTLRVRAPEAVARGEVMRIVLEGPDIRDVRVDLELPGNRHRSLPGFPVAEVATGMQRWQVLAGVDHVIPGGEAQLEILIETDAGRERVHRTVTIVETLFPLENIYLDARLSDLRRLEDPRRDRETRELIDLINHVNREARHHSGPFLLPLENFRRTAGFGDRRAFLYNDGEVATTWHNGLDMAAPTGTPVHAPAHGRVVMATDRLLTGLSVILEHQPGVYTIYYHLDQMDVDEDMMVLQGEQIGTVGATGLATGPHLHWEVRVGGVAVDPEWFVRTPLVDMSGIAGALSTVP